MGTVFGRMSFVVSTDVDWSNEELGILQANYQLNKDRFVAYKLVGITSRGEEENITVHDCDNLVMDSFVD